LDALFPAICLGYSNGIEFLDNDTAGPINAQMRLPLDAPIGMEPGDTLLGTSSHERAPMACKLLT
jgi:hypothetical protein